ncbi:glycosyltransferase [Lutimonas halocynthiae]|uniref:glycosyltransferase n=1 Tax=Lutimonas halocynthiae TaxID=1446477 RepID=UPI0025B5F122|nr:glycosyltransferase [Lutimonas halocynthiae]MDN3642103.1 glycosyltransferase [Lutimonas halocynthiae]
MKVSIVMSAYNCESFLEQALESLINQSYQEFELILFDDASTDSTKKIIQNFALKDTRIITVFNDVNKGLTANLNIGISLSKGEYIARMDADDIALPSRIEKQVKFLDDHQEIDLVGSAAFDINENGDEIQLRKSPKSHDDIIALLPKANPITHSTVMFRKKSFASIGYYNEAYRTTQDYEMWFRAAGKGLKFHNLQEILLKYRIDNNYHKRKSLKYRLYDCKLRLQCFKHINLPFYRYYYALIPIILGLLPHKLYVYIKKLDPRVNEIH